MSEREVSSRNDQRQTANLSAVKGQKSNDIQIDKITEQRIKMRNKQRLTEK
jgi:hypothetical protein